MEIIPGLESMEPAAILAILATYIFIATTLTLIAYVYGALTQMYTAKKLGVENAWLAWIPIGNLILMARMAKMPAWPFWILFGMLIPIVNILVAIGFAVYMIILLWKICEARNKPGWFAILTIIPWLGSIWSLILWGILAWSE